MLLIVGIAPRDDYGDADANPRWNQVVSAVSSHVQERNNVKAGYLVVNKGESEEHPIDAPRRLGV